MIARRAVLLGPKHEYSARIYAEILSAIGARMVELMGPKAALGVFSRVARPVGERDGRMLRGVLGLRQRNAASAAMLVYAAVCILNPKPRILRLDAGFSQVVTDKCFYGDAVLRYKNPLVCALCAEYNAGLASVVGATFRKDEKMISTGYDFCVGIYEAHNPASAQIPSRAFADLMIMLVKLVYNRNSLLVSTLSSLLVGLGERASSILGDDAALIPARAAFDAGKYQGPQFSRVLNLHGGMGDSALLVSAVRDALGCRVSTSISGGGFSLVTKDCPQKAACRSGNFVETACASYVRGLLSQIGDFEINSQTGAGVCKQEFRIRMPQASADSTP